MANEGGGVPVADAVVGFEPVDESFVPGQVAGVDEVSQ
jgi:hypothetical protein